MLSEFLRRHRELKERIHSFRLPLSPPALVVARVVYFTTPILAGYYLMQWVGLVRDKNLDGNVDMKTAVRERQERLKVAKEVLWERKRREAAGGEEGGKD